MWSSIQHVIHPESISEALAVAAEGGATLFAGGSYLVSEKPTKIHTLIDINHLIGDRIEDSPGGLLIGAGCTLQKLTKHLATTYAQAIVHSCPSKNIRNQRTLGGEIGRQRADSDLYVLLMAAGAQLHINGSEETTSLIDWDGSGLISQIYIPAGEPKLERVALLDSAPAFVILAVDHTPEFTNIAVGGKLNQVITQKLSATPDEKDVRALLKRVADLFETDHLGSMDYKTHLVANLLYEMTVTS